MDAGEPGLDASAPGVVAVVVTCDPGWWLEECLRSLAAQDYPALSVLVVDADSREDPTPRVAEAMPTAYVRRVRRRRGFAAACDEVLSVVEGATHYVFSHDDVALDPPALRLMVEEAFRSNAAVVAPKVVAWDRPDRLLAVGMAADRFGVAVPLVERGELDQEQHDAVREVFFAPSACTLVRADLFATLQGFDTGYRLVGEDLDLGWRAHLAGARVVAAPQARVRHLEATESGLRALDGSLREAGARAPEAATVAAGPARAPASASTSAISSTSPSVSAGIPPVAPGAGEVWDLARWDAEDDEGDALGPPTAPPSSSRSSAPARPGGRSSPSVDWADWSEGEAWAGDDEWETASRRRARRPSGSRPRAVPVARGPDAEALHAGRAEAQLRSIATDCGAPRAAARLSLLLALTLSEAVAHLLRGNVTGARRVLQPWSNLFARSGSVRQRRALVRRIRTVPDGAVVGLQLGGVARFREAMRVTVGAGEPAPVGWAGLRPISDWDPDARLTAAVWAVCLAVLVYGSRRLLLGHLPTIGELAPWPSVGALWRSGWSGWRATGLGTAAAAPIVFVELAVAGAVLLGHTAVLQHLAVLGMLPLGALGAARLARPVGSRRASLVVLVGYLVVPLPYNALYGGRWSGLVAYAAMPWVLGMLVRATGLAPFDGGRLAVRERVIGLALLTAAAGSVAPAFLLVVAVTGLALALPAARAGAAVVRVGAGAAGGAAVLLLPWSLGWLPPTGEWATFSGVAGGSAGAHLSTLLRFQTGTLGAGPLGYAVLVVAAFPLVVGRDWRLAWAVRLWAVALVSFASAWAAAHSALGIGWPAPEVLLAPAAAALALSAGLGMAALEIDLPGYNFGWRQVASVVAAAAAMLACLPVLALAVNGRWRQPTDGFDSVLSWMPPDRVLWVGRASLLPVPGWRLVGGIAYGTSQHGPPTLLDHWPATSRGPTRLLGQALTLAREGRTGGLGRLLAPMGVHYVVVVQQPSPLDGNPADLRPVPDVLASLDSQLDMEALERTSAVTVYRNDAWAPERFELPTADVPTAVLDDPRAARSVDLSGAPPVLPAGRGPVAAGEAVEVAEAPSSHWQLAVAGRGAERHPAWGSANLFTQSAAGTAVLRYRTPLGWRLAVAVEIVAWLGAGGVVTRGWRRA